MASISGTLPKNLAVNHEVSRRSSANRFRPFQKSDGLRSMERLIETVMFLSFLALLVISAYGAAGQLSGIVVGGTMVGLIGFGTIIGIVAVIKAEGKARIPGIINLIANIVLLIIGALTIAGMIPPTTAGWVVSGIIIGVISFRCLILSCASSMLGMLGGVAIASVISLDYKN